jgi:hypothetical protein
MEAAFNNNIVIGKSRDLGGFEVKKVLPRATR